MTERLTEEIIWDTRKSVPLRKFEAVSKTPCIVQLADVKTDTRRLPHGLSTNQALLLHSFISHRKIICSCPNSEDDQEKRFSLPVGYNGLVELLSENGESSPPLHLISEVANILAEKFLVRSKIEGLAEITDRTSIRALERGSVLTVMGTARVTSKRKTESYLHCTDKHGFYIYLNYETEGVFSPFAGPKNISGVHTIDSVVKRFRLPCTVRVVSGKIPLQACDNERPGVYRLLELRKESMAMIAPISAKQILIPLSLKADVSFYRPANMNELCRHFIFRQIFDSCTNKVEQYLTSMQVMVGNRSKKSQKPSNEVNENSLFEDVDEIYPYIRKGGIPPRMMRAHSLDNEMPMAGSTTTKFYNRSSSQPAVLSRERSGSLVVPHVIKQHTISSATTETTFQFRSTSDSLTLGKTDVLRQFIEKYTSKESLTSKSSQEHSLGSSDDDIYHTLDNSNHRKPSLSRVKDIVPSQTETEINSR